MSFWRLPLIAKAALRGQRASRLPSSATWLLTRWNCSVLIETSDVESIVPSVRSCSSSQPASVQCVSFSQVVQLLAFSSVSSTCLSMHLFTSLVSCCDVYARHHVHMMIMMTMTSVHLAQSVSKYRASSSCCVLLIFIRWTPNSPVSVEVSRRAGVTRPLYAC